MPDDKGTNITPLLDHIFSVGDIKTKNELQALIDALNKFPDDTKLDPKNLAILMEEIKKNRQS